MNEGVWGPSLEGYSGFERIGRGGFSTVYRARQDRLDRDVAVKVLSADLTDAADIRRFETECRVLGRLGQHRHIVDVYDAGVGPSGNPYIVMKLYAGGTLADRVKREGALPASDVVALGIKVSSALQAAHSEGVVHRDIKPENVLLDADGEPVLTDFGVAAIADQDGRFTSSVAFSRAYVAPEVLDRNEYGVSSDVYSLGATLYTMLSGRPVFAATTEARTVMAVLNETPAPLGRTDVPDSLEALVMRCLAKLPEERFDSAAALGAALGEVAGGLGATTIGGLIAAVPTAAVLASTGPAQAPLSTSAPTSDSAGDGFDDRTVARSSLVPPAAGAEETAAREQLGELPPPSPGTPVLPPPVPVVSVPEADPPPAAVQPSAVVTAGVLDDLRAPHRAEPVAPPREVMAASSARGGRRRVVVAAVAAVAVLAVAGAVLVVPRLSSSAAPAAVSSPSSPSASDSADTGGQAADYVTAAAAQAKQERARAEAQAATAALAAAKAAQFSREAAAQAAKAKAARASQAPSAARAAASAAQAAADKARAWFRKATAAQTAAKAAEGKATEASSTARAASSSLTDPGSMDDAVAAAAADAAAATTAAGRAATTAAAAQRATTAAVKSASAARTDAARTTAPRPSSTGGGDTPTNNPPSGDGSNTPGADGPVAPIG